MASAISAAVLAGLWALSQTEAPPAETVQTAQAEQAVQSETAQTEQAAEAESAQALLSREADKAQEVIAKSELGTPTQKIHDEDKDGKTDGASLSDSEKGTEAQAEASTEESKEESGASAETPAALTLNEDVRAGLLSPLERGGLLYYATVGFPEIRTGGRLGMNGYDLGVELGFDYSLTTLWAAVTGHYYLLSSPVRTFSLGGQVGAFGSFGSKWADDRNRPGQGIHLQIDGGFTHRFSFPLIFTATARIPLEVPVSSCGLLRFGLLTGAGLELPLSKNLVFSLDFDLGPMLWRPYGGVSYFKLAFDVTLGVTFRLF